MRGSVLFLLLAGAPAFATELVYVPVNPNFGGNPLNGNALLSNAQAQDDTKDPSLESGKQSSLQSFNDMLQRAILSRVAASVTGSLTGPDGRLVPGTVETSDFIITVVDIGGGMLQVTTLDKTTGQSTQFTVSSTP